MTTEEYFPDFDAYLTRRHRGRWSAWLALTLGVLVVAVGLSAVRPRVDCRLVSAERGGAISVPRRPSATQASPAGTAHW